MKNLAEFRKEYPQYDDLTDNQLLGAIHKKFYPDMPEPEFHMKMSAKLKKPESLGSQLMRGPKNFAAGLAKTGHKLINIPSDIAGAMGDKESQEILSFRPGYNYDKALGLPEEKEWHDIAAQLTPEIAGAFALPELEGSAAVAQIPKVGKYLNKILAQGAPQTLYSALLSEHGQAPESVAMTGAAMAPLSVASQLAQSTSPWARRGAQAIGGLVGFELGNQGGQAAGLHPLAANAVGGITGALGARGMTSQKMMQNMLTEGLDPALAKERLEASRRIGMDYLTPAEAGLNPYLAQEQGALGKTKEGSKHLFDKAQQRLKSEGKAITNVLDTIYHPEKMGPQKEALYETAHQVHIPGDVADKFKNNWIINSAQNKVENNDAFREKMKNIKKEKGAEWDKTIFYWDHVKKALSDMEKGLKVSNPEEAAIIGSTRRELMKELDKYSPEYKQARSLAEREKTRKGLEKVFNKKARTGTNFYKSIQDEEKFNKTLHSLRNVPEAQEKLKDMRMIFEHLIGSPSIKGAAALEATSMNKNRSSTQDIIHMLENKLTQGKYDKELIDFITNPKWDEAMKEIHKISDKQAQTAKFLEYFGKSLGVSVNNQDVTQ